MRMRSMRMICSVHPFAGAVPNPVLFNGVNTPIYASRVEELSDAPYCIRCKHAYVYDYVTYGHLGKYRCPACGYSRPEPEIAVSEVAVTDAEHSEVVFDDGKKRIPATVCLPGGYNIYNACAAMAAGKLAGLKEETVAASSASAAALAGWRSSASTMWMCA